MLFITCSLCFLPNVDFQIHSYFQNEDRRLPFHITFFFPLKAYCLLLPRFQIIRRFGFSRYIAFTMYPDIVVYQKFCTPSGPVYKASSNMARSPKLHFDHSSILYFVLYYWILLLITNLIVSSLFYNG
jgi:hypothetical protein